MLYLTCTTIISVDLAHYEVSRAKNWISVDCGTNSQLDSLRDSEKSLATDVICIQL